MDLLLTLGTTQDNLNFCRASFLLLQPHDQNSVTTQWTEFIEHPTQPGKFAVVLVQGSPSPILSEVDPDLFTGYLQKYVEHGLVTVNAIAAARQYLIDSAGGSLDISRAIKDVFVNNGGGDRILTEAQAKEQGWFDYV